MCREVTVGGEKGASQVNGVGWRLAWAVGEDRAGEGWRLIDRGGKWAWGHGQRLANSHAVLFSMNSAVPAIYHVSRQ